MAGAPASAESSASTALNSRCLAHSSLTCGASSPASSGRIWPTAPATYAGHATRASSNQVGCSRRTWRSRSATGSSGTSVDSGRQAPVATNVSAPAAAVVTSAVLPMPASPVTRRRPVPESRWRRTAASSSRRPAIRAVAVGLASGAGRRRARARWNSAVSPSIASTSSSSTPQVGSRGTRRRWRRWCGCSRPRGPGCAGSASPRGGGGRGGRRPGPAGAPAGCRAGAALP